MMDDNDGIYMTSLYFTFRTYIPKSASDNEALGEYQQIVHPLTQYAEIVLNCGKLLRKYCCLSFGLIAAMTYSAACP